MKVQRQAAAIFLSAVLIVATGASTRRPISAASQSSPPVLLEGTIVTMNAEREVIHGGRVLVRDGVIAALWNGAKPPNGVDLTGVVRAPLGAHAYIYPGLINLQETTIPRVTL